LTSKYFKNVSKRLLFETKKERENFKIIIVNFEGLIGDFKKSEFASTSAINLYFRAGVVAFFK
jgi:hypothetical protein